jgi:protocatechuate 3,4-dioxygenase beta subunit
MNARTTLARRSAVACASALVLAVALPLLPVGAWAQEAGPTATSGPTATAEPSPAAAPAPTAEPSAPSSPSPSATPTVSLLLSSSNAQVLTGTAVTLTATVVDQGGRPVPGETVDVLSRQGGTTTVLRIGRLTTDASGLAALTWLPRVSAEYTLRRASGAPATTERRIVHVQPTLSAVMSQPRVQVGTASSLRGTLAPAYAGARLQVQRRFPDGSWRGVAIIGTGSGGAYAWSVRPGIVGAYVFRAVLPATMAHRGVVTPAVGLTVLADPTLRQGSSGPAVRALEQRLVAQKVDVGAVDGYFDGDLRHGVTAFQKSQGLRRTGMYDAATRSRLANPAPVRLRYPGTGRAVEIDLVKQVLYLSEAGRLARIVDISSGNDRPYTVDGVTYTAFTPTGRFRVTRKIDGLRVSRLGELYRPAYFHQGWAIHGSPSVPTYPASHGCIRVTNSAQNRLFPLLTVGTPVSVYR